MTNRTDITVLRDKFSKLSEIADFSYFAKELLDQLEVERQRSAGSEEELHKALHREKAMERKLLADQEEIAALKGDQVPVITCYSCRKVMTRDQHAEADGFCPHCDVEIELDDDELFTAQQKPVVPDAKCDDDGNTTSEFDMGWNACRDAAIEAAGGVVSDK